MTAVAAVIRLDEGPVDPAVVRRMLACCPGDAVGPCVDGPAAVAAGQQPSTGDVALSRAPLPETANSLVLAWDGRLDNRLELLSRFTAQPGGGSSSSDAALVLAVYRAVGSAFLDLLVGDFGLVLWDGRARRLLAARDQLGVRPLHYVVDGEHCWIGSCVDQLCGVTRLGRRINERALGGFLAGKLDRPDATFFEGIHRVPAGHVLEIDHFGPRVRQYWSPSWERSVEYGTEAEYAEHLRTVLWKAVESRIHSARPAGLLLSGGLDSVAIAWATGELDREKNFLRHPFSTFTTLSHDLESPADRRRVKYLSGRYHFVAHYVPTAATWTFVDSPDAGACDEPIEGMYVETVRRLLDRAQDFGVGHLLTGYGGDLLLAGNRYYLFDLLLARQWAALATELQAVPIPKRWGLVQRYLVRPLLLGRPAPPARYEVPGWVVPDLATPTSPEFILPDSLAGGRQFVSRQVEAQAISIDQQSVRMLWYQREGARRGMELRHPFFDRRVLEFLLSVPVVRKLGQGRPKMILHRMLSGALPSVQEAPGEFAEVRKMHRHQSRELMRAHWEECFADSRLVSLGYVNRAPLDRAFRCYYYGKESMRYALARTFRAEVWLKRALGDTNTVRC